MCENKGIKIIQLIYMQQRTTKATNMVGKLGQVGRISLLNVQKEKVGFFLLFLSSVLTGWSHFLILTAALLVLVRALQSVVLGLPLHFHSQLRQIVVGAPCTPLPFPSQPNQRSKCITHVEDNSTTG